MSEAEAEEETGKEGASMGGQLGKRARTTQRLALHHLSPLSSLSCTAGLTFVVSMARVGVGVVLEAGDKRVCGRAQERPHRRLEPRRARAARGGRLGGAGVRGEGREDYEQSNRRRRGQHGGDTARHLDRIAR